MQRLDSDESSMAKLGQVGQLRKPLPREFYARDPRAVSCDLLGKVLVRREGRKLLAARIVEVEAYLGEGDPAAHAAAGRTLRNEVLFGPPGHAYVYFIYGNHWCFNAVCRAAGVAEAVLVRAIQASFGVAWMQARRGVARGRDLTNGPGKACAAMGIDRTLDAGGLGAAS